MEKASAHGGPAPTSSGNTQNPDRFRDMKLASGRFIVRTRLGGGSFGDIYGGLDTWRNKDVAIKLEQVRCRFPQLQYESRVYRLIHQNTLHVVGIPEMHWFGVEGDFNVMVIDLCGPSLEDLFNYCHRKFSMKTVTMLADQMMHRMEFLHSKQLIHRDIKPENFVMGLADKGHHVYLIDFGLSKRYWDARTQQHIPYKEGKPLTGTARYCSINTHLGIEQSRRDDMEAIGHLLIYLHKGHLPWQGIRVPDPSQKTVRIGEKKISIGLEYLCRDEPPQMLKYMKYCRSLKFEETPDYEWCRSLFREIFDKENASRDWIFDWVTRRQKEIAHSGNGSDELPAPSIASGPGELVQPSTAPSLPATPSTH
ncbi:casein kinase, putative [Bodo saltans]|uniref:non-specific serine/threonine protein kinase n=1 Tax=Bodo saltans TaxID=75058 RepID=A0A0S4JA30_BODSA|nr:casein kinase, putative [Bodo saltans]|eukprot:CUG86775.1 casein kinase, putative [Bodo saltans]